MTKKILTIHKICILLLFIYTMGMFFYSVKKDASIFCLSPYSFVSDAPEELIIGFKQKQEQKDVSLEELERYVAQMQTIELNKVKIDFKAKGVNITEFEDNNGKLSEFKWYLGKKLSIGLNETHIVFLYPKTTTSNKYEIKVIEKRQKNDLIAFLRQVAPYLSIKTNHQSINLPAVIKENAFVIVSPGIDRNNFDMLSKGLYLKENNLLNIENNKEKYMSIIPEIGQLLNDSGLISNGVLNDIARMVVDESKEDIASFAEFVIWLSRMIRRDFATEVEMNHYSELFAELQKIAHYRDEDVLLKSGKVKKRPSYQIYFWLKKLDWKIVVKDYRDLFVGKEKQLMIVKTEEANSPLNTLYTKKTKEWAEKELQNRENVESVATDIGEKMAALDTLLEGMKEQEEDDMPFFAPAVYTENVFKRNVDAFIEELQLQINASAKGYNGYKYGADLLHNWVREGNNNLNEIILGIAPWNLAKVFQYYNNDVIILLFKLAVSNKVTKEKQLALKKHLALVLTYLHELGNDDRIFYEAEFENEDRKIDRNRGRNILSELLMSEKDQLMTAKITLAEELIFAGLTTTVSEDREKMVSLYDAFWNLCNGDIVGSEEYESILEQKVQEVLDLHKKGTLHDDLYKQKKEAFEKERDVAIAEIDRDLANGDQRDKKRRKAAKELKQYYKLRCQQQIKELNMIRIAEDKLQSLIIHIQETPIPIAKPGLNGNIVSQLKKTLDGAKNFQERDFAYNDLKKRIIHGAFLWKTGAPEIKGKILQDIAGLLFSGRAVSVVEDEIFSEYSQVTVTQGEKPVFLLNYLLSTFNLSSKEELIGFLLNYLRPMMMAEAIADSVLKNKRLINAAQKADKLRNLLLNLNEENLVKLIIGMGKLGHEAKVAFSETLHTACGLGTDAALSEESEQLIAKLKFILKGESEYTEEETISGYDQNTQFVPFEMFKNHKWLWKADLPEKRDEFVKRDFHLLESKNTSFDQKLETLEELVELLNGSEENYILALVGALAKIEEAMLTQNVENKGMLCRQIYLLKIYIERLKNPKDAINSLIRLCYQYGDQRTGSIFHIAMNVLEQLDEEVFPRSLANEEEQMIMQVDSDSIMPKTIPYLKTFAQHAEWNDADLAGFFYAMSRIKLDDIKHISLSDWCKGDVAKEVKLRKTLRALPEAEKKTIEEFMGIPLSSPYEDISLRTQFKSVKLAQELNLPVDEKMFFLNLAKESKELCPKSADSFNMFDVRSAILFINQRIENAGHKDVLPLLTILQKVERYAYGSNEAVLSAVAKSLGLNERNLHFDPNDQDMISQLVAEVEYLQSHTADYDPAKARIILTHQEISELIDKFVVEKISKESAWRIIHTIKLLKLDAVIREDDTLRGKIENYFLPLHRRTRQGGLICLSACYMWGLEDIADRFISETGGKRAEDLMIPLILDLRDHGSLEVIAQFETAAKKDSIANALMEKVSAGQILGKQVAKIITKLKETDEKGISVNLEGKIVQELKIAEKIISHDESNGDVILSLPSDTTKNQFEEQLKHAEDLKFTSTIELLLNTLLSTPNKAGDNKNKENQADLAANALGKIGIEALSLNQIHRIIEGWSEGNLYCKQAIVELKIADPDNPKEMRKVVDLYYKDYYSVDRILGENVQINSLSPETLKKVIGKNGRMGNSGFLNVLLINDFDLLANMAYEIRNGLGWLILNGQEVVEEDFSVANWVLYLKNQTKDDLGLDSLVGKWMLDILVALSKGQGGETIKEWVVGNLFGGYDIDDKIYGTWLEFVKRTDAVDMVKRELNKRINSIVKDGAHKKEFLKMEYFMMKLGLFDVADSHSAINFSSIQDKAELVSAITRIPAEQALTEVSVAQLMVDFQLLLDNNENIGLNLENFVRNLLIADMHQVKHKNKKISVYDFLTKPYGDDLYKTAAREYIRFLEELKRFKKDPTSIEAVKSVTDWFCLAIEREEHNIPFMVDILLDIFKQYPEIANYPLTKILPGPKPAEFVKKKLISKKSDTFGTLVNNLTKTYQKEIKAYQKERNDYFVHLLDEILPDKIKDLAGKTNNSAELSKLFRANIINLNLLDQLKNRWVAKDDQELNQALDGLSEKYNTFQKNRLNDQIKEEFEASYNPATGEVVLDENERIYVPDAEDKRNLDDFKQKMLIQSAA